MLSYNDFQFLLAQLLVGWKNTVILLPLPNKPSKQSPSPEPVEYSPLILTYNDASFTELGTIIISASWNEGVTN